MTVFYNQIKFNSVSQDVGTSAFRIRLVDIQDVGTSAFRIRSVDIPRVSGVDSSAFCIRPVDIPSGVGLSAFVPDLCGRHWDGAAIVFCICC